MILEIQIPRQEMDAVFKRLGNDRNARSALKKALNATARKAAKEIIPTVHESYTVKRSAFRQNDIKVSGATSGKLNASIKISGEPQSIPKNYLYRKNSKRNAVKAQIVRAGKLEAIEVQSRGGGSALKAFIATISNGTQKSHTGIFQRVEGKYMNRGRVTDKGYSKSNTYKPRRLKNGRMTKGRMSIKELQTISNPKMVENHKVFNPWKEETVSLLQENLRKFIAQSLGG